jgi:hypothetical protein
MKSTKRRRFAVDFWGVQFAVEWSDPEFDEEMSRLMLPNWVDQPDLEPEAVFRLSEDENGEPVIEAPDDAPARPNKPSIVDTLERRLQLYLGCTTRQAVFVHAGVVGWRGGALVVPGRSFAGKSTLTLALLQAGATYYSDEYAIIDSEGLVHPFPRRLSVRLKEGGTERVDAVVEGFSIGTEPLPLTAVLSCKYEPGAQWQPLVISRGEGVLKMAANTVSAQAAPELTVRYLSRAVKQATCYDSPRGEALETAIAMLQLGRRS